MTEDPFHFNHLWRSSEFTLSAVLSSSVNDSAVAISMVSLCLSSQDPGPVGSDMHSWSVLVTCDSHDRISRTVLSNYVQTASLLHLGVICLFFLLFFLLFILDHYLSTASGLSSPPTTPTQAPSQPLFPQEAQQSVPGPERPDSRSRSRSLSSPPDTGQQRLSLPSAKPPIPSSSPVPPNTTSPHVSHVMYLSIYYKLFSSTIAHVPVKIVLVMCKTGH